ncbi:MAG: hypothetical protein ACTHN0_14845 [Aquihabitans sp.]
MKWLRKRVDRAVSEDGGRSRPTSEDRQAFLVFASSFLGRDATEGSTYDDRVRAAISAASRGTEAMGVELLAIALRDHDVTISLDELSGLARAARTFGVDEDRWAFAASAVER